MNILTVLFYQPIYNAIVVLYRFFDNDLGLAIIVIALLARLILLPFTVRQVKMAELSREFSEKSKEIRKKYKKNKEKQQEELMKLQSEYLPAQVSGCLPLIFQLIFFINLYSVIRNIVSKGGEGFNSIAYSFVPQFAEGKVFNTNFFGIDLSTSANELSISDTKVIPYILLVTLVGATQFLSMKVMINLRKSKNVNAKTVEPKNKKDATAADDFSEILEQSTRQTMFLLPAIFTFFAYSLPAGLSLYWTVQSSFVIIQQLILHFFIFKPKLEEDNK